ncbi:hypothetical protein [Bacillus thuringiensis]|uniref:hypothetical protein n=1 Tax=Bacillus thuringiensis TaxID=1428 RepID=UPI002D7EFB14|nr:hypothetical protein [Bacillus thuringiensis]MEB4816176.1 hypothetical protein [Bacillus thuringiensis]
MKRAASQVDERLMDSLVHFETSLLYKYTTKKTVNIDPSFKKENANVHLYTKAKNHIEDHVLYLMNYQYVF